MLKRLSTYSPFSTGRLYWIASFLAAALLLTTSCSLLSSPGKLPTSGSEINTDKKQPTGKTDATVQTSIPSKPVSIAQSSKRLTIAVDGKIEGLFLPLYPQSEADRLVNSLLYRSLFSIDSDAKLVPELADYHEFVDEGKRVLIGLRQNLNWHDGHPLTTQDVIFTLTALADPDYSGPYFPLIAKIEGAREMKQGLVKEITGLHALDDNLMEIRFTEPAFSELRGLGSLAIIPKHIWYHSPIKEWPGDKEHLAQGIGSGPYLLNSTKEANTVSFSSFSKYYGGAPRIEHISLKTLSATEALQGLSDGTVQLSIHSAMPAFMKKSGLGQNSQEDTAITEIVFNLRTNGGAAKDVNFRQAIAWALDRNDILNQAAEGYGTIVQIPHIPGSPLYFGGEGLTSYVPDPDKVKTSLQKATNNLGAAAVKSIELIFNTESHQDEIIANLISTQLKSHGIEVKLLPLGISELSRRINQTHQFQMAIWTERLDRNLNSISRFTMSEEGENPLNLSGFTRTAFEHAALKYQRAAQEPDRKATIEEMAKILNRDLPVFPLYVPRKVFLSHGLSEFRPGNNADLAGAELWTLTD